MRNAIRYYYNIYPDDIIKSIDNYKLFVDNNLYYLVKYNGNINMLSNIYDYLIKHNIYCHEIIINKVDNIKLNITPIRYTLKHNNDKNIIIKNIIRFLIILFLLLINSPIINDCIKNVKVIFCDDTLNFCVIGIFQQTGRRLKTIFESRTACGAVPTSAASLFFGRKTKIAGLPAQSF